MASITSRASRPWAWVLLLLATVVACPRRVVAQVPPTIIVADQTRVWWNDDDVPATILTYRAELYLSPAVTCTAGPAPICTPTSPATPPAATIDLGKPVADATGTLISPPVKPLLPANALYYMYLRALAVNGRLSPQSNGVGPLMVVAGVPCGTGTPLTVAVETAPTGWSSVVQAGLQGRVLFRLLGNNPVEASEIRLDTKVVAEQHGVGADFRWTSGQWFETVNVPPGTYNLTVWARDSVGCTTVTPMPRSVTVVAPKPWGK